VVRGEGGVLEASTSMQRPRVVSDWLMALASSKAAPSTPDFLTRSEPARSTRYSMPLSVRTPPVHRILSMSTACERDESAFIFVQAVARLAKPRCSAAMASLVEVTVSHVAPLTYTPSFGSSRSSTGADGCSRSEMPSR
jgi:hypothetical protein